MTGSPDRKNPPMTHCKRKDLSAAVSLPQAPVTTSGTVRQYLDSFINLELLLNSVDPSRFSLERFERLLDALGNPHHGLNVVHVAGTKGKGSTCVLTAAILSRVGFRVGLFTSPHLYDFRERIRILSPDCGSHARQGLFPGVISETETGEILEDMRPCLERFRQTEQYGALTFFEVLTALAFGYFSRSRVDYVVLETGLGGRLDATNVVAPRVFGITPISLEHTRLLGDTVEAIAVEKAAIIKAGRRGAREVSYKRTAVIAPQEPSVEKIIRTRCRDEDVEPVFLGRDITCRLVSQDIHGQRVVVKGLHGAYDLTIPLLGRHQTTNAAMAIGLVESLERHGARIGGQAIEQGVAGTSWPGRFEIVRKDPFVVLDCAHNPSSCLKVVETVKELFPGKKTILVLGVARDKDLIGICAVLDAIAGEVILTKADSPRARHLTPEDVQAGFNGKPCHAAANVLDAVREALARAGKGNVVLIAGSIFLVAEARKVLCEEAGQ